MYTLHACYGGWIQGCNLTMFAASLDVLKLVGWMQSENGRPELTRGRLACICVLNVFLIGFGKIIDVYVDLLFVLKQEGVRFS